MKPQPSSISLSWLTGQPFENNVVMLIACHFNRKETVKILNGIMQMHFVLLLNDVPILRFVRQNTIRKRSYAKVVQMKITLKLLIKGILKPRLELEVFCVNRH